MKTNRHLKLKAIAIGLALSITLAPAFARRAHAYRGGGEALIALTIVAGWITYVTAKALVCTPVAAARASKNENGFGGAYKDCWNGNSNSSVTANDDTSSATSSVDMPSKSADTTAADSSPTDDQTNTVSQNTEDEQS